MPRTARASQGEYFYHVLNRGNARAEVFHKPEDYAAFLQAMTESSIRLPMRLIGYCLMPNHFHLVLRPHDDGDLSRWMQWLSLTHVRRYLRHYGHSGHVWQGRFKAFPIEDDEHLVTVVRYVERNPLRAGLVARAEDWWWSSLGAASTPAKVETPPRLTPDERLRLGDWPTFVNQPMTEVEVEAVRRSIKRGRPFGSPTWTNATAKNLGLECSLRSRGHQPRSDNGHPS